MILNAHVTSSKERLIDEVGDFDDSVAPFYLLISTATRRLTLRTESSAERDRWLKHLSEVAVPRHDPESVAARASLGRPRARIVEDAELIFALSPMKWNVNEKGDGLMVMPRSAFRALCENHTLLADPFTVGSFIK